jgi:hypothetical protein
MDDELQNRFFQLKLQDLLSDCSRPLPTFIFERERPEIIELVRIYCLFSPMMIPYKASDSFHFIPEGLECRKVVDYGELYYLIFLS